MMSALKCSERRGALIEYGLAREGTLNRMRLWVSSVSGGWVGLSTQGRVLPSKRRALAEEHGHSPRYQEGVRVGYHI